MPSLEIVARITELAMVVTQPDRPSGRGQHLKPTPVKVAALEMGAPVFTPQKLEPALGQLATVAPDLFVLASYGKILPAPLLQIPKLGALNVHPSLLPLYRGATPIQSALRDGREATGVTIIVMDAGMDTGGVVLQETTKIGADENYGNLHDRLARQGAAMLCSALARVASGDLEARPQTGEASITRPLRRSDLTAHWSWTATDINNLIRAFSPKPSARATLAGVPVKLLQAHVASSVALGEPAAGRILAVEGDAALVACGEGVLALERLTPPNRSAISGAAFVQSCGGLE